MPNSLVSSLFAHGTRLAEFGQLPDSVLRLAIRHIVRSRSKEETRIRRSVASFATEMQGQPVAVEADAANRQHYEVASEFFQIVLGPRLKYSCALFSDRIRDLAAAEEAMLARTCERAGLEDGMSVLDLGCGWGSLSTWVAEHYPLCEVVAVSNSRTQRSAILDRCSDRGFHRVEVITANAATLEIEGRRFDRVLSVEMFEHMRNWHDLYQRIDRWLAAGGRFLQHVFCHRRYPYHFEDQGDADWMARNFFSGGIMPSFDLPRAIEGALEVEQSWSVDGRNYAQTARAWLERADANRGELLQVLQSHPDGAAVALQRWRMFFMACEELFGFRAGQEWFVGHYLLRSARS